MKIILGVTGGIAAYKACELVRLFKKSGHEVRVCMTAHAEQFVGALSFESLSGQPVLRSLHDATHGMSATAHIDLAQWGDALVVAPATANFVAKFCHGICDDALLTEALAFRGPIFLAPAMNTRMWEAPVTQQNLRTLVGRGVHMLEPTQGLLACGEEGLGKMIEPAEIFAHVINYVQSGDQSGNQLEIQSTKIKSGDGQKNFAHFPLAGLKILVTSGPTRSYLDPVRYLSNKSSGKMGFAVAQTARALGAEVVLVTGPVAPAYRTLDAQVIEVESADEMLEAARACVASCDLVIAAAAVADFKVPYAEHKIKKSATDYTLHLQSGTDVLWELAKLKKPRQIFIGFAAETENFFENAQAKILKKNLDAVVLNDVSRSDIGFDVDQNEVTWMARLAGEPARFECVELAKNSKAQIAEAILRRALALYRGQAFRSEISDAHH